MTVNIELLKDFFMWASIINIALLLLSSILITLTRGFVMRIHSALFKLSENTISIAMYSFLGAYKIITFSLFIIPWIVLEILH